MTRTTNARIAGFAYLAYIAVTIMSMIAFSHAAEDGNTAAQLASMAAHPAGMHVAILLGLVASFAAIILGVTLYAVTRDQDRDVAVFAMVCRVVEGAMDALMAMTSLALLWFATASVSDGPGADIARAVGGYLLGTNSGGIIGGIFYVIGNGLFAWLLLRGRVIPAALGWLGVAASGVLVISLPLELVSTVPGWVAMLVWLPALAYEIPLGFWLLIKGVGAPRRSEVKRGGARVGA